MNTDPVIPTPHVVDHPLQSKLAAQIAAMNAAAATFRAALNWKPDPGQHVRAGITKNKMRPRNKVRAKMARESQRRNRP